jgi:hypothetical protein
MPKRYVLLMADGKPPEGGRKAIEEALKRQLASFKVIVVDSNPLAFIVKTDNPGAGLLRDPGRKLTIGGVMLTPVLTSGAVGNLKRRARAVGGNGQVHER